MISSCWGETASSCFGFVAFLLAVLWNTGFGTLNTKQLLQIQKQLNNFSHMSLTSWHSRPPRYLQTCSWCGPCRNRDSVPFLWARNWCLFGFSCSLISYFVPLRVVFATILLGPFTLYIFRGQLTVNRLVPLYASNTQERGWRLVWMEKMISDKREVIGF